MTCDEGAERRRETCVLGVLGNDSNLLEGVFEIELAAVGVRGDGDTDERMSGVGVCIFACWRSDA